MLDLTNLQVGDRIKFKCLIAWRVTTGFCKVRGFYKDGRPAVKFNGFDDFLVRPEEIVKIEKGETL